MVALNADLADRKASGDALLGSGRVEASASASRQLSAGQVDSRLVLTITNLASELPLDIVGFSDSGPGAGTAYAASPCRSADLTDVSDASATAAAAFMPSMLAMLPTQSAPYVAARAGTIRLAGGQTVLRIEFAAPSPLGLLRANYPIP